MYLVLNIVSFINIVLVYTLLYSVFCDIFRKLNKITLLNYNNKNELEVVNGRGGPFSGLCQYYINKSHYNCTYLSWSKTRCRIRVVLSIACGNDNPKDHIINR